MSQKPDTLKDLDLGKSPEGIIKLPEKTLGLEPLRARGSEISIHWFPRLYVGEPPGDQCHGDM